MFNPSDPYDAVALYEMWLNCDDCDAIFDFEPAQPIDLDYYHLLGQAARQQGWFAAQLGRSGDEPDFQVCCPACAKRRGVMAGTALLLENPVVINDLCQSLVAAA